MKSVRHGGLCKRHAKRASRGLQTAARIRYALLVCPVPPLISKRQPRTVLLTVRGRGFLRARLMAIGEGIREYVLNRHSGLAWKFVPARCELPEKPNGRSTSLRPRSWKMARGFASFSLGKNSVRENRLDWDAVSRGAAYPFTDLGLSSKTIEDLYNPGLGVSANCCCRSGGCRAGHRQAEFRQLAQSPSPPGPSRTPSPAPDTRTRPRPET